MKKVTPSLLFTIGLVLSTITVLNGFQPGLADSTATLTIVKTIINNDGGTLTTSGVNLKIDGSNSIVNTIEIPKLGNHAVDKGLTGDDIYRIKQFTGADGLGSSDLITGVKLEVTDVPSSIHNVHVALYDSSLNLLAVSSNQPAVVGVITFTFSPAVAVPSDNTVLVMMQSDRDPGTNQQLTFRGGTEGDTSIIRMESVYPTFSNPFVNALTICTGCSVDTTLIVQQSTQIASGVPNTISAGIHVVSEDPIVAYTASPWGGDCASDGSITLNPNDNKICTITNDDQSAVSLIDMFLHGTGPNANPPTLFLDGMVPTATTAKFRDSTSVNFAGGNLWKSIGTWTSTPQAGTLTDLSDLDVWIGLKNSDDIGTNFDLRAEVYKNGVLVASDNTLCIQGVTRNPDLAKEVSIVFNPFTAVGFSGTDEMSLKVLTRIGTNPNGSHCGGHSNAVGLRLYFDSVSRSSMLGTAFELSLPIDAIWQYREQERISQFPPDFTFTKESTGDKLLLVTSTVEGATDAYIFKSFKKSDIANHDVKITWSGTSPVVSGVNEWEFTVTDGAYDRTSFTDFPIDVFRTFKGAGILDTIDIQVVNFGEQTDTLHPNWAASQLDEVTILVRVVDSGIQRSITGTVRSIEIVGVATWTFADPIITPEQSGTTNDFGTYTAVLQQ